MMLQIVAEAAGRPTVQCVMRIVQYSLKQLIVSVLQQLFEVWHVRWTEAASLVDAHQPILVICYTDTVESMPSVL